MQPMILDVDTGVDDLMELLYALAWPEVDLIGATCVTGNAFVPGGITSPWSDREQAETARVAIDIDAPRAMRLLIERLRELVGARADA